MLQISLAAARVNANLTQRDVAKALGISTQTLVNWEAGKQSLLLIRLEPWLPFMESSWTIFFCPIHQIKFDIKRTRKEDTHGHSITYKRH